MKVITTGENRDEQDNYPSESTQPWKQQRDNPSLPHDAHPYFLACCWKTVMNVDKFLDVELLTRREHIFLRFFTHAVNCWPLRLPSLWKPTWKCQSVHVLAFLLTVGTVNYMDSLNELWRKIMTNAIQGLGKKGMRQMSMILPVKSENPEKLSSSMWQASIRLLKRVPTGSSGCPTQPSKLVIEVMLLWGSSV